jgi:hypothetical protein
LDAEEFRIERSWVLETSAANRNAGYFFERRLADSALIGKDKGKGAMGEF